MIVDTNLSDAWCTVLEKINSGSHKEISPLIISLSEFHENERVKEVLNADLLAHKLNPIDTVAETIFPNSLYHFFDQDREALFTNYKKNIPRIRKADPRNHKGTYFERLISFSDEHKINQLEIIITALKATTSTRRSKLQACTFDPVKDHTNSRYQGFPCLQHVTFFKSETGGLVLNSFYAIQYVYQKAYGNWLGLINLGKFVAAESNLHFETFNCFIGVEQLEDKISKTRARELMDKINEVR